MIKKFVMKLKMVQNLRTKSKMQQQILKDQLVQKMMINLMKFVKVKKLITEEVEKMLIQLKKQE